MKTTQPPISKFKVLSNRELVQLLFPLVGVHFTLTRKPRTDGSSLRKLIESRINTVEIENASSDDYSIIPFRGKGIPKLLILLMDSYLVTSGETYNLQVWNRNPNGNTALIKYKSGEIITPQDIRYIMVKVSVEESTIESILILSPQYIEDNFGKFGKPTIKSQLLISAKERENIIQSDDKILFYDDTPFMQQLVNKKSTILVGKSTDKPTKASLLPLSIIKEKIGTALIGVMLEASDTKTRGQALERLVIELLGYATDSKLVGGYPDVPNQLLEVKVQDTQTVDLGKYSPQFEEIINTELNISTYDVRYLIALTNPNTNIIEGVIISSGRDLGKKFTYVSDTSYKCQRSIPMSFFDKYKGMCTFNP